MDGHTTADTCVGHLTIMRMQMLLLVSDDDDALRWLWKIKEELEAVGKRALEWDRQRFYLVPCPPSTDVIRLKTADS